MSGTAQDNDRTLAALASCCLASQVLSSLAIPLFLVIHTVNGRTAQCWTESSPQDSGNQAGILNQILAIRDIAASVQTMCTKLNAALWKRKPTNGISAILHHLPHLQDCRFFNHNHDCAPTWDVFAFHVWNFVWMPSFLYFPHQFNPCFSSIMHLQCISPDTWKSWGLTSLVDNLWMRNYGSSFICRCEQQVNNKWICWGK